MFLKFLSGRSLLSFSLLLVSMLMLSSCTNPALKFLTGGGPNVAANTQLGQENNQTIGQSRTVEQTIVRPQARTIQQNSNSNKVEADSVETVVVNEVPMWVILLAIIGWLLPTPQEMVREFFNLFRRNK